MSESPGIEQGNMILQLSIIVYFRKQYAIFILFITPTQKIKRKAKIDMANRTDHGSKNQFNSCLPQKFCVAIT